MGLEEVAMSQKDLANSLKAVIIGVGLCGLVIYFYFLPVWGKAILQYAPEIGRASCRERV